MGDGPVGAAARAEPVRGPAAGGAGGRRVGGAPVRGRAAPARAAGRRHRRRRVRAHPGRGPDVPLQQPRRAARAAARRGGVGARPRPRARRAPVGRPRRGPRRASRSSPSTSRRTSSCRRSRSRGSSRRRVRSGAGCRPRRPPRSPSWCPRCGGSCWSSSCPRAAGRTSAAAPTNSAVELLLGYDGLGRIFGAEGGAGGGAGGPAAAPPGQAASAALRASSGCSTPSGAGRSAGSCRRAASGSSPGWWRAAGRRAPTAGGPLPAVGRVGVVHVARVLAHGRDRPPVLRGRARAGGRPPWSAAGSWSCGACGVACAGPGSGSRRCSW